MLDRFRKKSIHKEQLLAAHTQSGEPHIPFKIFVQNVLLLAKENDGPIDFDENFYLKANTDVANAVRQGVFPSGYIHFCLYGKKELRPWSTRYLTRRFGVTPHTSTDFTKPINDRLLPTYGPDLSSLPDSTAPFLLVFLPHLEDDLFFAGYSSFFSDLSTIFHRYDRIVIVVAAPEANATLATRYCDRIEVFSVKDLYDLKLKPNVVFCFDSETFYMAKEIFNDLERTIYYCQDFEAGFFPFGTSYARAEGAVAQSRNIVLSTVLLKNFLEKRDLLSAPRVFVTSPKIDVIDVTSEKTKKLFFYFRPEAFNTRNMPELIRSTVDRFCQKHTGYEIYLVGTVSTSYSYKLYGTDIAVINKLPKEQYINLLSSCDVVVAFIYSAHPGVIAFQAAASGIPTVTNIFENRDAVCLKEISENIVPFDPVREDLLGHIETALSMAKGKKSFTPALYKGVTHQSFAEYVDNIMQINLSVA